MVANYLRAYTVLNNMIKSAYWDYEKLINYQNNKIKYIVKYAYENVPYYNKLFKKLNISPEHIRNKNDLNKIPILTKEDIRKNTHDFISRKYNQLKLKKISTSGSTGMPLKVWINQVEDEIRKAKHIRANKSYGQKLRDKWVIITSPHHFGASTKLQNFLRIYVPTPVSVFHDVDTQMNIIKGLQPDILDGYSSSLLLLSKEIKKRGEKTIKPRFLIGGAELIDIPSRNLIENQFNAPFYDQYACIEFDRIAWQCSEKIDYHVDVETLALQFIKEGEEVTAGEKGEIVCTSLFNEAMPLIRYSIGDMGIPSNEKCPCGRNLPFMKMVEGRMDSMLYFPDGKIMSPRALTVAISTYNNYTNFDQFRIIQKKKDLVEIQIKMKKDVDIGTIEKDLKNFLHKTLMIDPILVTFNINFVEDIPLDKTGKLMMVRSELQ